MHTVLMCQCCIIIKYMLIKIKVKILFSWPKSKKSKKMEVVTIHNFGEYHDECVRCPQNVISVYVNFMLSVHAFSPQHKRR